MFLSRKMFQKMMLNLFQKNYQVTPNVVIKNKKNLINKRWYFNGNIEHQFSTCRKNKK